MSDDPLLNRSEETPDDPSRRLWLLRLGEFVALAGVSGILPEFTTHLAAAGQAKTGALPPGLYDASPEHLVHALSSAKWTPPPGSETEYVLAGSEPYSPKFFSTEDFPIVTRFVEILLGKVDGKASAQAVQWFDFWLFSAAGVRAAAQQLDPMHRTLAVAYYGEEAIRELENLNPQETARAGLQALKDLSSKLHGREFRQLTESEQAELVTAASKPESGTELHKFFEEARRETIRGYYTTAEGLEDLDYKGNAYYGDSPGCNSQVRPK